MTLDQLRKKHRISTILELEQKAVEHALRATDGDKRLAAKLLGIGKTTFYRHINNYAAQAAKKRGGGRSGAVEKYLRSVMR